MFTVYDGMYAYVKQANSGLYLGCKTSIFNDPSNQIFTNKATGGAGACVGCKA